MLYCYIDLETGDQFTSTQYGLEKTEYVQRDYRAEGVGIHIPSHMRSSNTSARDDFLPTAKDFEKPGDSDGSKGLTEWNENHEPAPGNKSPHRPSLPAGSKRILPFSDGKHK